MWHQAQVDRRTLGAWSFELRDDELADVRFAGRRALRSIRAVVRDRNWATAQLVVDRLRSTDSTLAMHVRSVGLGSTFRGVVRVEARPAGLVVIADLESEEDYWTNRTGLVVLHPPQAAGAELEITHSDDAVEVSAFPRAISPHQPASDIAELRWVDDGLEVAVEFDGDVFEMEDQRNWTDASFKTYSRPLDLPFPYLVAAGERVRQSLTVRARSVAAAAADDSDDIVLAPAGAFPEILVGAATAADPAPSGLAPVGAGLLVEVDLATPHWRAALERAGSADAPLDVRVVLDPEQPAMLQAAASALSGLRVLRVAAFDPVLHVSDAATVVAMRLALAEADVDVPVVGGARSHFTELNREQHRLPDDLDGVTFSITPLFHSLTTEQLVESVGMQRLVAQQAVEIADGAPVHVGPVTLRPRFNNVATTAPAGIQHPDLSAGYGPALLNVDDARQDAPELAAWTVASAAALAVPGVASIAYFEDWGPRGIRDDAGRDRPVAEAVRALASLSGRPLLSGSSSDGLVWAIGAGSADAAAVIVANLDRRPRTVTVRVGPVVHDVDVPASATARL